jgi:hypothetical protein
MEKRLYINTQSTAFQGKSIDIEKITDGVITKEMFYSLPVRDQLDAPDISILISDSVIYAIEKCRFNVWKWEHEKWVNKYKNNNKGLCIMEFYLHNNELLGFTSDGFWFSQSAIYAFNELIGGWELRNIENEVPPFLSCASFKLGNDTIISFISAIRKNGEVTQLSNSENYGLDLKTNTWFRTSGDYELKYLETFFTGLSFDMENTFHAFASDFHVILDKKTKQIYYEKLMSKFAGILFYYNDCKSGVAYSKSEIQKFKDEIPANSAYVGEISFSRIKEKNVSSKKENYNWLIFFLVLMVLFGFLLGRKGKIIRSKLIPGFQPSALMVRVMKYSGQSFSSDEIDEIIKIDDDPNHDSRRVKRSRIILGLNTEYKKLLNKELITRKKDPKDKRYTQFHIQK